VSLRNGAEAQECLDRREPAWSSARFGLQATLRVLEHGFSHFSGDSRKPGNEIVDPRAAFKIFEQRFNRDSRAAKYPDAANPVRIALDSRARRPS